MGKSVRRRLCFHLNLQLFFKVTILGKIMPSILLYILFFTLSSGPTNIFAQNTTNPDLWVVYDTEVEESKTSTRRQPPSCILAGMKAKIDIFGSHLPSSSYELFPKETQAENLTCEIGSDQPEQKLILNWHPDSVVAFFFRQENGSNLLQHVNLRILIPLDEYEESYYELVAESEWDLEMMKAPNLFAFFCKNPIYIPMEATVSKVKTNDQATTHTPLLSDGELIEPMSFKYNATLELADVKMELFRVKRYYNDFTHLQYDCEYGWPYEWVAHTILTVSMILAVALFVNFTVRFYKGKEPNNNDF